MKIYKEEKALAADIASDTSLSYCTMAEAAGSKDKSLMLSTAGAKINDLALADIKDSDLYFHKSILVSTNWNNNDDVFLPSETWAARHTPTHKPTNFNHESSKIVGHITANWAIDTEGELIDDSKAIDEIPPSFHILTGSVIYKKYHNDPDYEREVAHLIEEIEAGRQFVSMECHFKDFDYAIRNEETQEVNYVARAEDTAFLTKHLRRFGGTGTYENYTLGRVLKNISFIGKAYTPRPANKESIIFTNNNLFDFAEAKSLEKNSVLSLRKTDLNGDDVMSDVFKEQADELKKQNASLAAELEELRTKLAKADVQKFEDQIETLILKVDNLNKALAEKDKEVETFKSQASETKTKLEEVSANAAQLEDQLGKVEAERVFAARVSSLVDGGVDRAVAETKVKLFVDLNDEQFKAVADEFIAAAKKDYDGDKKMDEAKSKEKKKDSDDAASAEAADLEDSKADEDVSTASDTTEDKEDEKTVTIASLSQKLADTFKAKGDK